MNLLSACGSSKPQILSVQSLQWVGGIAPGSFVGTQLQSSQALTLSSAGASAGQGFFLSPSYEAPGMAEWLSFKYLADRPYGKALPHHALSETGYPQGNASMDDNVLLLHLDSEDLRDLSGQQHQAIWQAKDNLAPSNHPAGVYQQSLSFSADSESSDAVVISHADTLSQGAQDLSLEAWVYLQDNGLNEGLLAAKGSDYAFGFKRVDNGNFRPFIQGLNESLESSSELAFEQWAHVAFVYQAGQAAIYVNGELVASDSLVMGPANEDSLLLGGAGLSFNLDELALYQRALSASEIQERYRRGASQVLIQVRNCLDQICDESSDEGFIGPDGTLSSYYSEALNSSLEPPLFSLLYIGDSAALQFRVLLKTLDGQSLPVLQDLQAAYVLR